jgi:HEAT repeat protein
MLDTVDSSSSLLRFLVYAGLGGWSSEALLQAIRDKSVIVRTAAARRLHLQPDVDVIFDAIVPSITGRDPDAREIAAFVLGQLGTPSMPKRRESYPYLVELLSDRNEYVRAAAADGIGRLSYDDMPKFAEDGLVLLRDDVSESVRGAVAYALGNSSGRGEAHHALELLLRDRDVDVRSWAELGMELLSERTDRNGGK